MKCGCDLSYLLGKSEISNQVLLSPENFLIECVSKDKKIENLKNKIFMTCILKYAIKDPLY